MQATLKVQVFYFSSSSSSWFCLVVTAKETRLYKVQRQTSKVVHIHQRDEL